MFIPRKDSGSTKEDGGKNLLVLDSYSQRLETMDSVINLAVGKLDYSDIVKNAPNAEDGGWSHE